jgi:flagellar hook-length control protein FliK
MTDVIKPTVAIAPPDRVANSQEMSKSTAASPNGDFRHLLQREVTSTADFRHLLENQASVLNKPIPSEMVSSQDSQAQDIPSANRAPAIASAAKAPSQDNIPPTKVTENPASLDPSGNALPGQQNLLQGMPKLALHDPSLKIGRVILTGDSTPLENSQLTQFMRDHGFSEGGMAGYMKQTMLGAGSAIADAASNTDMPGVDSAALTVSPAFLGEEALEVPTVVAAIPPVTSAASETAALATGINAGTAAKPDSLPLPEIKGPLPLAAEAQSSMRTDATVGEAVAPTSTKDILSAQWPQLQDEQRQVAATQAAERDTGAADVEFANQQQSGQRSGQGEQNAPFSQTNPANNEEAQTKAQQYREWSERFSELLGTRLAVAVREGSWSVQLDLDAMDLGSVAIQLSAGADGIEGQVTSSDPAVRQLLADSLPKLQAALAEALGDQIDQASVSLSLGPIDSTASEEFKTVALSAQELSNVLPADFKAGDGLSVFV